MLAALLPAEVALLHCKDASAGLSLVSDVFQGCVISCDLTGFTALTSEYQQAGDAGVEALQRILNTFFQEQIGALTKYGADVVGFLGDCVLGLFRACGHENRGEGCPRCKSGNGFLCRQALKHVALRATRCALELQSRIEALEVDGVRLRVKVAIGAGCVLAFHGGTGVGMPHIDDGYASNPAHRSLAYFITGPAVEQVSHLKVRPDEVVLSDAAMALVGTWVSHRPPSEPCPGSLVTAVLTEFFAQLPGDESLPEDMRERLEHFAKEQAEVEDMLTPAVEDTLLHYVPAPVRSLLKLRFMDEPSADPLDITDGDLSAMAGLSGSMDGGTMRRRRKSVAGINQPTLSYAERRRSEGGPPGSPPDPPLAAAMAEARAAALAAGRASPPPAPALSTTPPNNADSTPVFPRARRKSLSVAVAMSPEGPVRRASLKDDPDDSQRWGGLMPASPGNRPPSPTFSDAPAEHRPRRVSIEEPPPALATALSASSAPARPFLASPASPSSAGTATQHPFGRRLAPEPVVSPPSSPNLATAAAAAAAAAAGLQSSPDSARSHGAISALSSRIRNSLFPTATVTPAPPNLPALPPPAANAAPQTVLARNRSRSVSILEPQAPSGDSVSDEESRARSARHRASVDGAGAGHSLGPPTDFVSMRLSATSTTEGLSHRSSRSNHRRPSIFSRASSAITAQRAVWLSEFRTVSVVFAKMDLNVFFSERAGRHSIAIDGKPAAAESLAALFQRVLVAGQAEVFSNHGTMRQFIQDDKGDIVLLAIFGLPPASSEDDPLHAFKAALDLSSRLTALRVPSHIAVTTGRAFCSLIGDVHSRCEYAVLGAVVNLAARVMQKAPAGEVLVDEATRGCIAERVAMEQAGELALKGLQGAVKTYRILAPEGGAPGSASAKLPRSSSMSRRAPSRASSMRRESLAPSQEVKEADATQPSPAGSRAVSPAVDDSTLSGEAYPPAQPADKRVPLRQRLIGRAYERRYFAKRIQTLLGRDSPSESPRDPAERFPGGVLIVEAEAGHGKTMLVEDFIATARAAGVRVVLSRCSYFRASTPLHAWRSVVLQLLGLTEADMKALAPSLGSQEPGVSSFRVEDVDEGTAEEQLARIESRISIKSFSDPEHQQAGEGNGVRKPPSNGSAGGGAGGGLSGLGRSVRPAPSSPPGSHGGSNRGSPVPPSTLSLAGRPASLALAGRPANAARGSPPLQGTPPPSNPMSRSQSFALNTPSEAPTTPIKRSVMNRISSLNMSNLLGSRTQKRPASLMITQQPPSPENRPTSPPGPPAAPALLLPPQSEGAPASFAPTGHSGSNSQPQISSVQGALRKVVDSLAGDGAAMESDKARLAALVNDILPTAPDEGEAAAGKAQVLEGARRRDQQHILLVDLLRRSARNRPTLLVFEDAHWADSASWGAINALAHARLHGLLTCITMRPTDLQPGSMVDRVVDAPGTAVLELSPLAAPELADLVATALGVRVAHATHAPGGDDRDEDSLGEDGQPLPSGEAVVPPELVSFLATHTAGLPFFASQVVLWFMERELLTVDGGRVHLACDLGSEEVLAGIRSESDSVNRIVCSRIDRLDPSTQSSLKVASVCGLVFSEFMLDAVIPPELQPVDVARSLATLHELGFIRGVDHAELGLDATSEDVVWAFSHNLIRDVAYSLITFALRCTLHNRVAYYYEEMYCANLAPFYPLIASHFVSAKNTEKAIEFLEKSGEQADQVMATQETVYFYTKLLDLGTAHPAAASNIQRACWHRRLGDVYHFTKQPGLAADHFRRALALLGDRVPETGGATVVRVAAELLRYVFSSARLRQGAARKADPQALRAATERYEAWWRLQDLSLSAAKRWDSVLASLTQLNLAHLVTPELQARCHATWSVVLRDFGLAALARREFAKARDLAEAADSLRSQGIVARLGARVSASLCRWRELEAEAEVACHAFAETSDLYGLSMTLATRAQANLVTYRTAQDLEWCREVACRIEECEMLAASEFGGYSEGVYVRVALGLRTGGLTECLELRSRLNLKQLANTARSAAAASLPAKRHSFSASARPRAQSAPSTAGSSARLLNSSGRPNSGRTPANPGRAMSFSGPSGPQPTALSMPSARVLSASAALCAIAAAEGDVREALRWARLFVDMYETPVAMDYWPPDPPGLVAEALLELHEAAEERPSRPGSASGEPSSGKPRRSAVYAFLSSLYDFSSLGASARGRRRRSSEAAGPPTVTSAGSSSAVLAPAAAPPAAALRPPPAAPAAPASFSSASSWNPHGPGDSRRSSAQPREGWGAPPSADADSIAVRVAASRRTSVRCASPPRSASGIVGVLGPVSAPAPAPAGEAGSGSSSGSGGDATARRRSSSGLSHKASVGSGGAILPTVLESTSPVGPPAVAFAGGWGLEGDAGPVSPSAGAGSGAWRTRSGGGGGGGLGNAAVASMAREEVRHLLRRLCRGMERIAGKHRTLGPRSLWLRGVMLDIEGRPDKAVRAWLRGLRQAEGQRMPPDAAVLCAELGTRGRRWAPRPRGPTRAGRRSSSSARGCPPTAAATASCPPSPPPSSPPEGTFFFKGAARARAVFDTTLL